MARHKPDVLMHLGQDVPAGTVLRTAASPSREAPHFLQPFAIIPSSVTA